MQGQKVCSREGLLAQHQEHVADSGLAGSMKAGIKALCRILGVFSLHSSLTINLQVALYPSKSLSPSTAYGVSGIVLFWFLAWQSKYHLFNFSLILMFDPHMNTQQLLVFSTSISRVPLFLLREAKT